LKVDALRALSDEELEKKLAESRKELFHLRFQSATGALENTARLRAAKREIARILTLQFERARQFERAGHGKV
jgi:large subunit ribosomal protein L29